MIWDEYKKAFEPDGSWRDIYLTETEVKTWKTLLEFLAESDHAVKFFVDKTERKLNTNAFQIFQDQKKNLMPLLTVDAGGVTLHCHFFDQNEIEFDFDPREVTSEEKALAIFEFMSQIGAELGKDVFLTEEDAAEDAWFIYDTATKEIIFFELLK